MVGSLLRRLIHWPPFLWPPSLWPPFLWLPGLFKWTPKVRQANSLSILFGLFDKVVALVVQTERYYWTGGQAVIELPVRVVMQSESTLILDRYVDCHISNDVDFETSDCTIQDLLDYLIEVVMSYDALLKSQRPRGSLRRHARP